MKRFRLSRAAENDLRGIWSKGLRDWGAAQADTYLRALDECFHLLGEYPNLGHRRDDIGSGYYSFPKGEHHIYYRREAEGLFVVRVRPQRMLPRKSILNEGSA